MDERRGPHDEQYEQQAGEPQEEPEVIEVPRPAVQTTPAERHADRQRRRTLRAERACLTCGRVNKDLVAAGEPELAWRAPREE